MQNVNTAKKVGRPVKASLNFVRKFSDGSRIEIFTDISSMKIGGFNPVSVSVYRFNKANEVTEADEKKFFGEKAETAANTAFASKLSEVIAGTYKFPSEVEKEESINRILTLVGAE